jgi:hypothetical protein
MSDAPAAADDRASSINFVKSFLDKYFPTLPKALQSIVYFVFLALFVYSFFRFVGGDFAVHGQVFKGSSLVQNNFDVCIGEGRYGTNNIGDFYAVLPPSEYYAMLLRGSVHVEVFQGSNRVHQQNVTFTRFPPRLEEIDLEIAQARDAPARRWDWSVVSSAYAQARAAAPPQQDRLFVEHILINDADAQEAEATLYVGSTKLPLLLDGRGGARIPLRRAKEIDVGDRFYFAIPPALVGQNVTISVAAKTGLFSSRTVSFSFWVPPRDVALTVTTGSSRIIVRHRAAR